jgi:hypothetical protein
MATRSPVPIHNFWGNAYLAYANLPNVSAADFTTLEEGDIAYIPSTELFYVCVDPTPGAAVWTAQAPNDASRIVHTPGITPSRPTSIPGQEPTFVTFGTPTPWLLGLHFDKPNVDQALYGYAKIQTSYVGPEANFHVHWTKAVDTDQSGATVRWVLDYHVFNGTSNDVQVAPTRITWDVTYLDTGLTSRIVYRTPNSANIPAVAGYYIGFRLSYDPANTTLSGGPVAISCDVLMRQSINEGN